MGRKGIHTSFSDAIVLNPIAPKTDGGSLDLANGQIGLFSASRTSQRGRPAVADLTQVKGNEHFYIEVGTGINSQAGGYTSKNMQTVAFLPKDVLDVTYNYAKPATQGEVILGYDGFDTSKSIALAPGESGQVHIKLVGDPLAFYGFHEGKYEKSFAFSQPEVDDCEDECVEGACHDIVKQLTNDMKETLVREGIQLQDLIDIRFISDCSDNPDDTVTANYYELVIKDNGDANALALVQGQYPGYQVVRIEYNAVNTQSTYQIVKTDGTGLPSAYTEWFSSLKTDCGGSCPSGYTLSEGGYLYSVSWEDDGADQGATVIDSIIGLTATAGAVDEVSSATAPDGSRTPGTYTGVNQTATSGAGTGIEFTIVVGAGGSIDSITITDEGEGYAVTDTITIADADLGGGGGAAVTVDVDGLATVVVIAKVGQEYGVGKYSIVSPTILTSVEESALLGASPTLALDSQYTEVEDVCIIDTLPTTAWTAGGTCSVGQRTFIIDLHDDNCNNSRLADLQANYPTLTIVEQVLGGVVEISHDAPEGTGITPGTYTGIASSSTSGSGTGATWDIVVNADGDVVSVTVNAQGSGYATSDTVTIAGNQGDLDGATPDDDITVTVGLVGLAPAGCIRRYTTTVLSQIVCDECRTDQYTFDAPSDFEFAQWKEVLPNPVVTGTDSTDCNCGIAIKGKDLEICPPKELSDRIGTINGQIRVEISGGELLGHKIGYKYNTDQPWPKKRVSRAFDGTGWGHEFHCAEKESYDRFLAVNQGMDRAEEWFKGTTTKLDTCTQYDTVTVKIRRNTSSQGFSKKLDEFVRYIFILPPGSRELYESFFNTVAGANPEIQSLS